MEGGFDEVDDTFFFNPGVLETANLHHGPSRLCQSKDRALKDELKEQ